MSKITKVFLMISAVLAGAGLVLCIVGFSMGAKLGDITIDGKAGWYFRNRDSSDYDDDSDYDGKNWNAEFSEIKNLKMDIGVMEVTIEEYDGNQIRVEAEDMFKNVTCKKNGDTLEVKEDGNYKWSFEDHSPEMTIYVPENTTFEKVELNVGVGSLEVSDFSGKNVSIDCGVGEVYLEGRILGNSDITCGVGSVELELDGRAEDFNYDVSSGFAGTVEIDGEDIDEYVDDKKVDNGADKQMKIDCGVGSISISFDD